MTGATSAEHRSLRMAASRTRVWRIAESATRTSSDEMSFEYSILESPMGVENYTATFRLIPVTDSDQTFAEWTAEFDAAPAADGGRGQLHRRLLPPRTLRSRPTRWGPRHGGGGPCRKRGPRRWQRPHGRPGRLRLRAARRLRFNEDDARRSPRPPPRNNQ